MSTRRYGGPRRRDLPPLSLGNGFSQRAADSPLMYGGALVMNPSPRTHFVVCRLLCVCRKGCRVFARRRDQEADERREIDFSAVRFVSCSCSPICGGFWFARAHAAGIHARARVALLVREDRAVVLTCVLPRTPTHVTSSSRATSSCTGQLRFGDTKIPCTLNLYLLYRL